MNNDFISYPDREIIDIWRDFLTSGNSELRLKLPYSDDDWYNHVLATIERIKIPYLIGVHCKASHLFYNLNKGHNFVDGNKRTSIMVTYLFYILNGYKILNADKVETLAKKVARSKGTAHMDTWIEKIERDFLSNIEEILQE